MEKIAYITDSSSFLDEKQANDLGFHYIPLHVIIEGNDYLEGINLNLEQLKEAIETKKNVSTSQPSPGEILALIDKLKKEGYTKAIFSGIASGLSRTQENVASTSTLENFEMYIIDSKSVGNAAKYPLLKVRKLIEEDNMDIKEAVEYIQANEAEKSFTDLLVGDLFHLSRGGRITATAAALGSLLKIKPILKLDLSKNGQIDAIEKVRTAKKAYKRMVEIAFEDIDDLNNYVVLLADFYGEEVVQEIKEIMEEKYPGIEIERYTLSPSIGVHTGLDSVGLQIVDKRLLD